MRYKLSFIIPIYSRALVLPRCINSVLEANCNDVQIILVDDATTDNSVVVEQHYAELYSNVKLIICEENGGPGVARNVGIENADGQFLLFLDSDDQIETKNLSALLSALTPDIDLLVYNTRTISFGIDIGSSTPNITRNGLFSGDEFFEAFDIDFINALWYFCFSKRFSYSYNLRFPSFCFMEDFYFMVRALSCAERLGSFSEILYFYVREGLNQLTTEQQRLDLQYYSDTILELISDTMINVTGRRLLWLQSAKNMLLWRPLKESRETIPAELTGHITDFVSLLDGIKYPVWFMPAKSFTLFQEVCKLAAFPIGGFLDNVPRNENMNVAKLRSDGFTVCTPQENSNEPNAIVLFSENYGVVSAILDQLYKLGYKLVAEKERYAPRLLINYHDA